MTLPMTSEPRTYNDYTVGWICALPKEQTAATAMLDEEHVHLPKPPKDNNIYTLGSIGRHNTVIACLPKGKYGNNSAAIVATQMVDTFPSIKVGLMVGIGGGIPPKVRLGDVVVSSPVGRFPGVVQWDFGKAEEGGNFRRTGALDNPPRELLAALAKLESEHEMKGSRVPEYLDELQRKWPQMAPKYASSNALKDILFEAGNPHCRRRRWPVVLSTVLETFLTFLACLLGWWAVATDYGEARRATDATVGFNPDGEQKKKIEIDEDEDGDDCRFCDTSRIIKRKPRAMRIHYGLIASGNKVIKDATLRDTINEELGGNVLCIEMEAAGLENFPCIVIRGICDYADSHKNKAWQEHAAAIAAAVAKEFLLIVPAVTVEQMPTIKNICHRLEQIATGVDEVVSRQRDQQHQDTLDWLTRIDYGPQQVDNLRMHQKGSSQWLLDDMKFQTWVETAGNTLFCPGIPGAGKTILTSIVVNSLTKRYSEDPSVGIVYIYCNFRRQDEEKVDNLLASLLKQLAEKQITLPSSLQNLYNRHKRTRPPLDEISTTLRSVAALYSRVFIIVDALDECQASDGSRTRFLKEIFHLQETCSANFFVTSRFIPEITERFTGSESIEIRASKEDVQRYVEGHIGQLRPFVAKNRQLQEEIKLRYPLFGQPYFSVTPQFRPPLNSTNSHALKVGLQLLIPRNWTDQKTRYRTVPQLALPWTSSGP